MAMQHQKPAPVGGLVHGLVDHLYVGKQAPCIIAGEFIMVAGHEDNPRAMVHLGRRRFT